MDPPQKGTVEAYTTSYSQEHTQQQVWKQGRPLGPQLPVSPLPACALTAPVRLTPQASAAHTLPHFPSWRRAADGKALLVRLVQGPHRYPNVYPPEAAQQPATGWFAALA